MYVLEHLATCLAVVNPTQRRNSSDQSLSVVLPGSPASSSSRAAEYLSAKFKINAY